MNYKKIYDIIIDGAKNRKLHSDAYGENHHIIPRCMGGTDDKNNIVRLTAREHFVCHQLLFNSYRNTQYSYALILAVTCMKRSSRGQIRNNRIYEWVKIRRSKELKTWLKTNHPKGMKGKHHTETIKKQISEINIVNIRFQITPLFSFDASNGLLISVDSLQ